MIRLRNVSKSWREFSLRNISFQVGDDEYFVILGPTGAGKTLLLELIAGLHYPDRGEIWINDREVTWLPPEKRNVGFVFQDYFLFPHLTVRGNVEFGLKTRGFSTSEANEQADEVLDLLNISDLSHRYPETLSGGERQKVALARALAIKPDVFLLDEPLSALDAATQEILREELKRIHRRLKVTTIHVTHNHVEAMSLADRIGILSRGEMVQVGTPEEIFRKPASEFAAKFVGAKNLFAGKSKVSHGMATIDTGRIQIEAITEKEGNVLVCIRPEDITLLKKLPPKSSARNIFEGKITEISDQGVLVRLSVNAGEDFTVLITRRSFLEMGLNVGSKVFVSFKASSVHVI